MCALTDTAARRETAAGLRPEVDAALLLKARQPRVAIGSVGARQEAPISAAAERLGEAAAWMA